MKYRIHGAMEMYWSVVVDADNEDEAREKGFQLAELGSFDIGEPTGDEAIIYKIEVADCIK